MSTRHRFLASAAIVGMLALPAAGCSSSGGSGSDAARSAAASLTSNPQFVKLENQLLANFKKDFQPMHPITSMESAVEDTFPGGSGKKVVNYAVKTFTLKAAHKGQAQTLWVQGVVTFALQQGAQGVPSGAASPTIPGVTNTPASTS